jgi:hypothetical protein
MLLLAVVREMDFSVHGVRGVKAGGGADVGSVVVVNLELGGD